MFFGTPQFAATALTAITHHHDVVCVISQPDKKQGRRMLEVPTPVKEVALSRNIPVHQPETLKDQAILPLLCQYEPQCIVVVAYGRILPEYILKYPKEGCINIHASLLPKYRGAAPIQWALINCEPKTGVTIMHMTKKLDAGNIILMKEQEITNRDTSATLFEKLSHLGAAAVLEALQNLHQGYPQDHSMATYAPMITRETGEIDWSKTNRQIHHLVRAMIPWPGAYSFLGQKRYKILDAQPVCGEGCPGDILENHSRIVIACGEGALQINELQFDNKRKMLAQDYLKGNAFI